MSFTEKVKVGVLGASGYTGAELIRLLNLHPNAEIAFLTANRFAGQRMADVYPHLSHLDLPDLIAIEEADWKQADVIFCGLPHGTTQETIKQVLSEAPESKIVDLSADFRLSDLDTYAEWYGHAHQAPELQAEAVYGLTEIFRDAVAGARLVGNPGCYTTAAQLPLIPLIEAGLIEADGVIIDAKSGVTGAGRSEKQANLHAEISEGMHAYAVGTHRHACEIEQGLTLANGGKAVMTCFTPHLVPMNRGILATSYVKLTGAESHESLHACLSERYDSEPFVHVMSLGVAPATREVRGTNQCRIGVFADRVPGRAILVSVIDNLVKGASGQAIQNMNVMLGLEETAGLDQVAMFP
ncbi:N-acetyl-gamma-glutamyl-phosphate reductase [Aestuariispira insulae]|uniref:N-acetyl-gamma-glutamyl-phosphate reductase n=1 Tax=Aestuariispira insulae TaxID=1461337 RepID=A0A3D9HVE3_9PROT|nr:N-acetyl-gamma-glutamyl-phosphate reductase [Aestuariispira insulae]RED53427.1 N-acetyl-gamma-glutamyl-phosphate reductase [Aestuariispira insulae]